MSDSTHIDDVSDLARTVMTVLAEWDLQHADSLALLGLPESTKPRSLTRIRTHGTTAIDDDFMERARLILAIRNAVDSLYPHNQQAALLWVTTPNSMFNNVTPVQMMVHHGIDGMKSVLNHLDGVDSW